MLKLGFIGAGNMGSAILRGLIHAQYITADDMAICDLSARKLEELSDEFPGLTCTESEAELVEMCDMIVLAVTGTVAGVFIGLAGSLLLRRLGKFNI